MSKKEEVKNKIIENIDVLDIAGYLKEELVKSLDYFHYYKLNNILKNIGFLNDYLIFLDKKNTKQIDELEFDKNLEDIDIGAHDLSYYISKNGLDQIGEKKMKWKIVDSDYKFLSVLQGIKGFLLLTVDEFCNATPVRLSIDQVLRNKEVKTY